MLRIIYDTNGTILTVQHWAEGSTPPDVSNIKVEDIEKLESEIITDVKVENGELKFNKVKKAKTPQQQIEELENDILINSGVI